MTQRVIDACKEAELFINRAKHDTGVECKLTMLVPIGDELATKMAGAIPIIEGPEENVIERYRMALDRVDPDYVVRITGDCPMIPPYVITKHIKAATNHHLDYISNVDERYRTAPDGYDCEVISAKLLRWAWQNAETDEDREHVTTIIRRCPPKFARIAHVIGYADLSDIKLSVDTEEDLRRVDQNMTMLRRKHQMAEENPQTAKVFRL